MFKKGHKIWLGKKHTEETKKKMSIARRKRDISKETKLKISNTLRINNITKGKNNGMYGKYHTKETIEKIKEKRRYQIISEDTKRKMSENRKGNQNGNWKGGITSLDASIRSSLKFKYWRESIFKKDNFTCVDCGDDKGGNLNAHHIEHLNSLIQYYEITTIEEALNCIELWDINNGITLCEKCHKRYHKKMEEK